MALRGLLDKVVDLPKVARLYEACDDHLHWFTAEVSAVALLMSAVAAGNRSTARNACQKAAEEIFNGLIPWEIGAHTAHAPQGHLR